MRTPFQVVRLLMSLLFVGGLMLLTAVPAHAQEASGGQALGAVLGLAFLVIFVVFYIYFALATQVIANKTNTGNAWMAWIPVANLVLWANIARKPVWWGLLCMIPLVNLVFMVLLWMAMAEARQKPGWWGILMIVPCANLIVPGYLAWSN